MRTVRVSPYTLPVILTVVLLSALLVAANAGATARPQEGGPASADATPQYLMNYQGRLLHPATGEPLPDGAYEITFTLYDKATDGAALWSETGVVNVAGGVFTTVLGDGTPLTPGDFTTSLNATGQTAWLGIRVNADPEMQPRQQLTFVGYAVYANNADTLDGQDSAAFAPASHTHTTLPIAFAFIQANGTKASGTANVTSGWANNRYEIAIDRNDYVYSNYATLVTLVSNCPAGAVARTSSVGGKLLVYVYNSAGTFIQCDFQFVTFKP